MPSTSTLASGLKGGGRTSRQRRRNHSVPPASMTRSQPQSNTSSAIGSAAVAHTASGQRAPGRDSKDTVNRKNARDVRVSIDALDVGSGPGSNISVKTKAEPKSKDSVQSVPRSADSTRPRCGFAAGAHAIARHLASATASARLPSSRASLPPSGPTAKPFVPRTIATQPTGTSLEDSENAPNAGIVPMANIQQRVLPDLTRVAQPSQIAATVANPPQPAVRGYLGTRPFSLDPPPYSDKDIPLPQPYNTLYPHPLTAYASPGVNPAVARLSGYDQQLAKLSQDDMESAIGSILYDAGFRSLDSSVHLFLRFGIGNGNGIPESLWSKLEHCTLGGSAMYRSSSILGANDAVNGSQLQSNLTLTMPQPTATQPINLHHRLPASTASSGGHMNPSVLDWDPTPKASPQARETFTSQIGPSSQVKYGADLDNFVYPVESNIVQTRADPRIVLYGGFVTPPSPSTATALRRAPQVSPSAEPLQQTSPFHKTELCALWEQTGHCKYGNHCQYAHGMQDLRSSHVMRHDDRRSPPPAHRMPAADRAELASLKIEHALSPSARGKAASIDISQEQQVLVESATCPPKGIRRLTFPLPQVSTVVGGPPDPSDACPRRREVEDIPVPIGAERALHVTTSPSKSTSFSLCATGSLLSPTPWLDDMPAFSLAITPRKSSSPESESVRLIGSGPSSSSLSMSTLSSQFSDLTSFEDGLDAVDVLFTRDHKPNAFALIDSGFKMRSMAAEAGSPFVEYSNGRSIWQ
ncbi:hypothetical protein IAU60_006278 [Kwoniella sp. DSM 27419]